MIDARQFKIWRELIMHLKFKKVLELRKTKIFLAIPYSLMTSAAKHYVSPLSIKPLKRERRNSLLNWLTHIATGRIKRRQETIKP